MSQLTDPNLPPEQTGQSAASKQETEPSNSRVVRPVFRLAVKLATVVLVVSSLFGALFVLHAFGLFRVDGSRPTAAAGGSADVSWICPMMCVPPSIEPGRCPVCGMELVAAAGGGTADPVAVVLDPAARRIAHIQTVVAEPLDHTRTIRSVGVLGYDEGNMRSIAAYVDGRIEKLFADFVGVQVTEQDRLAYLYSPRLYTAQIELLESRRSMSGNESSFLAETHRDLYQNTKTLLVELGMTEEQINAFEREGKADSRLHILSPISGTVIAKHKVEGQYVKEGEVIYELADLSNVWLMLELFPEDAAAVCVGHSVEADVQSLPGDTFEGTIAFIDPNVDPRTRTVGVRVEIANPTGSLKIGDLATARIRVPLGQKYAGFGHDEAQAVVVPRNAVLLAGQNSVAYVETNPGRYEIRNVSIGPQVDGQLVITGGITAGERVATRGNFLIDSQMQLAGNPSLIDPSRAIPQPLDPSGIELTEEMIAALSELSDENRKLADVQVICPVTEMPLGSMGVPPRVTVDGRAVLLCCAGCEKRIRDNPKKYFAKLEATGVIESEDSEIEEALAELSADDRKLARAQKLCPVADFPLGSMGPPNKVDVNGRPVFICCEGCRDALLAEPAKFLAKIDASASLLVPDPPLGSEIESALAELSPADQELARTQKICPVADQPLGSMGTPAKVDVYGRPVFICCEGCRESLLGDPEKFLRKLATTKTASAANPSQSEDVE